jgi:DDE superfamily endonuclease
VWLPKYAPELNDIEVVWRDLRAHHLAHQTFADTDALDRTIHHAIDELNAERLLLPLANLRISGRAAARKVRRAKRRTQQRL